jgi:MoaA/NifB/PqqE/SkfB family radical SAM enzyme
MITAKKDSKPRFQIIYIEITNSCNIKCDFCPSNIQTRRKIFMETSDCMKIISEIAEYNLSEWITLNVMGEPLLHRDVVELCRYAEGLGISVRLLTNGFLLNEQLNKRLFATGLTNLEISFRTPNEFAFGLRSGSKSLTLEDYKNKIKRLLADKIEYSCRTRVLIKFFNKSTLSDFICGNSKEHLTNINDNLSVMRELQESCLLRARLLGKDISRYKDVKLRHIAGSGVEIFEGIYIVSSRLFYFWLTENSSPPSGAANLSKAVFGGCETFNRDFGILSNGDVTTCCMDYNGENVVGNVRDRKLVDILANGRARSVRNHFNRFHPPSDLCRRCLGGSGIVPSILKQIFSVANVLSTRGGNPFD